MSHILNQVYLSTVDSNTLIIVIIFVMLHIVMTNDTISHRINTKSWDEKV